MHSILSSSSSSVQMAQITSLAWLMNVHRGHTHLSGTSEVFVLYMFTSSGMCSCPLIYVVFRVALRCIITSFVVYELINSGPISDWCDLIALIASRRWVYCEDRVVCDLINVFWPPNLCPWPANIFIALILFFLLLLLLLLLIEGLFMYIYLLSPLLASGWLVIDSSTWILFLCPALGNYFCLSDIGCFHAALL